MIRLALLGKGISHSLSPELYQNIYGENNLSYKLYDYDVAFKIPDLDVLFREIDGLSITAPYKEHFIKNVIIKDEQVRKLNAINCIGKKDELFIATNTDLSAMRRLLPEMLGSRDLLILGSGAMARVVSDVASEIGKPFTRWSRSETPDEFEKMKLESISDGNVLVVNCCAREYVFSHTLPKNCLFWDMNYRHQAHLQRLQAFQGKYIDGLNLLQGQAEDAAAFWSSLKN